MSMNEAMEDDDIEISEHVADEEARKRYADLYVAAVEGDLSKAEEIFKKHPGDVRAEISDVGDTVLHVAAAAGKNDFLKKLVSKYMEKDDLEKKNKESNTAFSIAAMSGDTKLAELMLAKNRDLAMIRSRDGMLPILVAAFLEHDKMVRYLYEATRDNLTEEDHIELLVTLIDKNLYGIAIEMVRGFPKLAVSRAQPYRYEEIGETALHALARKPLTSHDFDKPKQRLLTRYYYQLSGTNNMPNKGMHPKARELVILLWRNVVNQLDHYEASELISKPRRLIFDAAKEGNLDFLSIITSKYPDLIYEVDEEKKHSIFHVAVLYRQENIFKLMHKISSIKNVIVSSVDEENNNILHLAAKLPRDPNRLKVVSGAALQMQRELWWFQEVSKLLPSSYAEAKNHWGLSARTLFTDSHEKLMKEGEEWMKKTAESCMLVATLIATVVFAAAFTVPGGLNNNTGAPNFIKKTVFIIFALSDTISLVSSACSILTFLSILTASYAEEDFLWFLPPALLFGLSTLLVSIIGMMAVFCATLFIVFGEGTIVPAVLGIALASMPVIQFILQQKRIISDVLRSMSKSLFLESQNINWRNNWKRSLRESD